MDNDILLPLWASSPALSAAIWSALAIVVLYLARRPAHICIRAAAHLLVRLARVGETRLNRAAAFVRRRGRGALMAFVRDRAEQTVAGQLRRLGAAIDRDLGGFPELARQLHDQIAKVDEDYRSTDVVAPTPPQWLQAVDTVAALPGREDPTVGRVLEDMHATLDRACHETLLDYRVASRRRHRLLRRMRQYWQRMDSTLEDLRLTVNRLQGRITRLDRRVAQFEALRSGKPGMVRELTGAASLRALAALMVFGALMLGAVVAFHLIAQPLAQVNAGAAAIAGVPFAAAVASVILALLALCGGLLLESMRVTRLFPDLALLEERLRRALGIAAAVVLSALLACMAALASSRDYLLAQDVAAMSLLAETASVSPSTSFHWIPALIHGVLATALGGAIAMAALPLQSLLRQGQLLTIGAALIALRVLASGLRLLGFGAIGTARLLLALYDLLVFVPMTLENLLEQRKGLRRAEASAERRVR